MSSYVNMIKSLITNPSFNQDTIMEVLNGYKEAKLITEEEFKTLLLDIEDYYSVSTLKEKQIYQTKVNLAIYLEEHPMFSYIKHKDGRFYRVTQDKQQQLTSTLLMYQGYLQNGYEYPLTWNDTGSVCEPWTFEELFSLAAQVNNYVKPLVALQQETDVTIQLAKTKEEVLAIDVNPYK